MLGLEAVPAALYFIFLFFVPRSPRWLMQRGRKDEALAVLNKVESAEEANQSIAEIQEHIEKGERAGASLWTRLAELFSKRLRFILFIGLGLAFFQQITGINAIFFYAPIVFEKTGASLNDALLQQIIIGLVNLGFTIVAIYYIDRLGRRPLLLIGTAAMAVCLFTNAWAFHSATYELTPAAVAELPDELQPGLLSLVGQPYKSQTDFTAALDKAGSAGYTDVLVKQSLNISAILVLLAIIGYIAAFAVSIGPVMWAMFSEIFPNHLRGVAISVAGLFNSLVSYSVQQIFPWELSTLGPAGTFFIFGVFATLAFVFTIKFIPETKGKTLEELEEILIKN
jgi:MFS family permease